MATAYVGATLFDGTSRASIRDACLVVDEGKIAAILPSGSGVDDAQRVDASGLTVIPGLIDCHIHLAMWGLNPMAHQDSSMALLACETVANLSYVLDRGVTYARDLGGLAAGFRDGVERGLVRGPRLKTSVAYLSPTAGMMDKTTPQGFRCEGFPGTPDPVCDGPDEVRRKVREVARSGADLIKVGTTGGVSSCRCHPWQQTFSRPELEAAIDEAHRLGLAVACHALAGPGVRVAVEAGVDTLEHGAELDEDCVTMMVARGTWYVPTLAAYRLAGERGKSFLRSGAKALEAPHRKSMQLALARGVKIAMGSDAGPFGLDSALEIDMLVEAGMSRQQALVAATGDAAKCVGVDDRVGTLEVGKDADLVFVIGDPLSETGLLRNPECIALVTQRGNPVAGVRRSMSPPQVRIQSST